MIDKIKKDWPNTVLRLSLVLLFSFVCCEEGQAQKNSISLSLEQQCEELSKQSGYKYEAIKAEITRAWIDAPMYDCLGVKDCIPDLAMFSAVIKVEGGQEHFIQAKPERKADLKNHPLYMEEGKYYGFCAREINRTPVNEADKAKAYQIDFLETIVQLD